MYCEFYQLTERPFNVTPDPKFLYLNARYREAIASLNYGITQRKGFITLIGEAGTGKTTLLKKLLEDLDSKTKSIFIFNTHVTFEEILEYIFAEFELPVHNGKKLYMLQRLNTFLLEELRGGGNVALLIDEAQDLEFSVLEDLRLLSNLETAKEKILQIVLSGQPELGQKLSNPVLRQLRQRIGINCRLLPLSRDEISEYIRFRLEAAGCPDLKLFTREAEDQVYHFSRGIPRLVNVVCDNALVIGYALGKKRIGAELITEAAADLLPMEEALPAEVGEAPLPEGRAATAPAKTAPPPWRTRAGVLGAVVVAVLVGLLSVGRTMLSKHMDEPVMADARPRLEVIRPGVAPRSLDAPPAAAAAVREAGAGRPEPAAAQSGRRVDEVVERASLPAVPAAAPVPAAADAGAAVPRDTAAAPAPPAAPDVGAMARLERNISLPVAHLPKPAAPVATMEHPEAADGDGSLPPADESVRLDGVAFAEQVVRTGDSMSAIAQRKYGQSSYTILDLLKLANPGLHDIDLIGAGQRVRLPELAEGLPVLSDATGQYSLLLFSTPQLRRAMALRSALRARGFDARVATANVGGEKELYRVVVSGSSERSDVVAVGQQVQELFRKDTRLAQLGE